MSWKPFPPEDIARMWRLVDEVEDIVEGWDGATERALADFLGQALDALAEAEAELERRPPAMNNLPRGAAADLATAPPDPEPPACPCGADLEPLPDLDGVACRRCMPALFRTKPC